MADSKANQSTKAPEVKLESNSLLNDYIYLEDLGEKVIWPKGYDSISARKQVFSANLVPTQEESTETQKGCINNEITSQEYDRSLNEDTNKNELSSIDETDIHPRKRAKVAFDDSEGSVISEES